MPLYAFTFMVFTLANVGLPGTSGFVGEFLALSAPSTQQLGRLFATSGVILSAAYALYLYRRVIFGVLDKASLASHRDLSRAKSRSLRSVVALTIYYGVWRAQFSKLSGSVAKSTQLHRRCSRCSHRRRRQ